VLHIYITLVAYGLRQYITPFRFETKSVQVKIHNTLFLSVMLYGCEFCSVCLSVTEDADGRCWASGAEGITWLEDHLKIEFRKRECERMCLLDWNISGNELKCFVNNKMKFGLYKMRGIASIAERQALFQEGILLWVYLLEINVSNLFVMAVILYSVL